MMPTLHKCTKEREIQDINVAVATLKNDIDWTKNTMKEISHKLDVLIETMNESNSNLNRITKDVYGNGVIGLKTKVSNHHDYIQSQQGTLKAIFWFLGITQPIITGILIWLVKNSF